MYVCLWSSVCFPDPVMQLRCMGEESKHFRNDEACTLRGWSCIPLVVEVFGGWGNEAIDVLSKLSNKVVTQLCHL